MEVSASLKRNADAAGRGWLRETGECCALLNAVMALLHPGLFECGMDVLLELTQRPEIHTDSYDAMEVLKIWPSIFNALSIISNRESPRHRDNNSRPEWYDLLTSVGPFYNSVLELPGIGVRLAYNPGTVFAFSGRVLQHGVCECVGERVSLAFYMRDNVHDRVKVRGASWMEWDEYNNKT